MALDPYPDLSLANARKKTIEARELAAQSIEPKVHRDEVKQIKLAEIEHTFEKVASDWQKTGSDASYGSPRR